MNLSVIKNFSPIPLAIFALVDVLLYNTSFPIIQLSFTIVAYLYVLFQFLYNQKKGILYFFAFNILTIGIGNYWGDNIPLYSYWGLRIGSFSANILFSILLVSAICIRKRFRSLLPKDSYSLFFLTFILYGFILGACLTLCRINYVDNFKSDILIFLPMIFYMILCNVLEKSDLVKLIKYIIPITIYSLLIAYIAGKEATYSQESFVIGNAFVCIAPFAILLLKKYFDTKSQIIYISIYVYLTVTFSILLGGKGIISFIILIIWLACLSRQWRYVNLIILFAGIPLIILILEKFIEMSTGNSGIVAFKLSQVLSIISNPNFLALASEYSSIGNIIAEAITLISYLIENLFFLFFGKGFGGGIPDIYGFLSPFAGAAGYAEVDAMRNDFFNLHIAPYKILIDGGIIMFIYYLRILWSLLSQQSAIGFLAFLMMLFYFYVSKEFMLLSYILLRLCLKETTTRQNRVHVKTPVIPT